MPKDKNLLRVVRERMDKTGGRLSAARAQLHERGQGVSARERAAHALSKQVEHLRDAADAARAAGLSLAEIGRVLRVEPEFLRTWLLSESLEDGDPA